MLLISCDYVLHVLPILEIKSFQQLHFMWTNGSDKTTNILWIKYASAQMSH